MRGALEGGISGCGWHSRTATGSQCSGRRPVRRSTGGLPRRGRSCLTSRRSWSTAERADRMAGGAVGGSARHAVCHGPLTGCAGVGTFRARPRAGRVLRAGMALQFSCPLLDKPTSGPRWAAIVLSPPARVGCLPFGVGRPPEPPLSHGRANGGSGGGDLPTRPRARLARPSAILLSSTAAGADGSLSTRGRPASPPSRSRVSIGTWPSSGTASR